MNLFKKFSLAVAMAVSVTSLASAQTTVYVTGSTAYRANAIQSIEAGLSSGFNVGWDANAADEFSATHVIFYGTIKAGLTGAGDTVIIKTSWNGSGAGVQAVAGSAATTNAFHLSYVTTPTSPALASSYSHSMPVGDTTYSQAGDIVFSDVYQVTTGWSGSVTYNTTFNGSGTPITPTTKSFADLSGNDNIVGVVPFVFVTSPGSTITNITPQLAQGLWASSGKESLALFSGVSSDESKYAYGTGRNPDSGTRLTAFAETGVGTTGNVNQYQPLNASGAYLNGSFNTPVASVRIWPTDSTAIVNGTAYPAGDSGYASGGSLGKDMSNTVNSAVNGYLVAYLGTTDAIQTALAVGNGSNIVPANATNAGAKEISYNGTSLPISVSVSQNTSGGHAAGFNTSTVNTFNADGSTATSTTTATTYSTAGSSLGNMAYANGYIIAATINNMPIIQGQYTFWSFEHVLYPTLTGDKLNVAGNIVAGLQGDGTNDNTGTAQITVASMNVTRGSDGGQVGSLYY